MDNEKVFTDFDDFLRTCLPNYYAERSYRELTPAEVGRKAAEDVMRKVKIGRLDNLR